MQFLMWISWTCFSCKQIFLKHFFAKWVMFFRQHMFTLEQHLAQKILALISEGNDRKNNKKVYVRLSLVIRLIFTWTVNLSLKSDWLIEMLSQNDNDVAPRKNTLQNQESLIFTWKYVAEVIEMRHGCCCWLPGHCYVVAKVFWMDFSVLLYYC